ncbi:hypothetical protein VNO78_02586 [Psophocarpus tetragonolobus]|uniref:Uncharacterized protein n=1 Tax=Psophocarpus tetragonolobus TaxID=3891 RepID=A0AAN9SZK2_PSOTE
MSDDSGKDNGSLQEEYVSLAALEKVSFAIYHSSLFKRDPNHILFIINFNVLLRYKKEGMSKNHVKCRHSLSLSICRWVNQKLQSLQSNKTPTSGLVLFKLF